MLKIGIIIALIAIIKCESCPNEELLYPCVCNNRDIICGGKEDLNLQNIFKSFSLTLNETQKSFTQFFLNNTAIKRIESNTFFDITFITIYIEHADSLERIHRKDVCQLLIVCLCNKNRYTTAYFALQLMVEKHCQESMSLILY
jgi:hypothetical protein